MRFGEWLKQTREAKGISAYRLALDSGLSKSYISNLETGRSDRQMTPPSDSALERMADVLGIHFDDLRKAALRDRMARDELEAAAEIVAEDASPEQLGNLVRVHFRAKPVSPEDRKEFVRQLIAQIKGIDENWDDFERLSR